jgi:hypothetical protein
MRSALTIVGLVAQILIAPSIAWACGCGFIDGESFEAGIVRQHASAEQVFVGRVIRWDEETVTFAVETIWKGDVTEEVSLKHGEIKGPGVVSINTCDYHFQKTGRYLVFAERSGTSLKAGNCGDTKPVEESARAIAVLDTAAQRRTPQGQPSR